jgi:hypothetical protein
MSDWTHIGKALELIDKLNPTTEFEQQVRLVLHHLANEVDCLCDRTISDYDELCKLRDNKK